MHTQKAIESFTYIRDIPYRIPLSLAEKDCCCSGKHIELKALLEQAGYTVRHRVCSFTWSSMHLPTFVAEVPHTDTSTHSYVEILLEEHWIPLDATWDSAITSVLPCNAWDGISTTPLAVRPIEIFSPEKSDAIMTKGTDQEILDDLTINGAFYAAFNEWLETARKS